MQWRMRLYFTIYKITNTVNGKYYIGQHQTTNIDDGYMGSGKLLWRAYEKYGIENFVKEILAIFESEKEMNDAERRLVQVNENTYNLCPGGTGGFGYINKEKKNLYGKNGQSGYGLENLLESKARHLNLIRTDEQYRREWISKLSQAGKERFKTQPGTFTNKTHSPETKATMSQARKGTGTGMSNSQFGSMWITDGHDSRKIRSNDLIPSGWYKGRVVKSVN